MDCCGFEGPKEFAYNNEPIDDSCYDDVNGANSGIVSRREDLPIAKKMKQVRKMFGLSVFMSVCEPSLVKSSIKDQIHLPIAKKMKKVRKLQIFKEFFLYFFGLFVCMYFNCWPCFLCTVHLSYCKLRYNKKKRKCRH